MKKVVTKADVNDGDNNNEVSSKFQRSYHMEITIMMITHTRASNGVNHGDDYNNDGNSYVQAMGIMIVLIQEW